MNIYIANLNFKVTNDELKSLFEEFGDVVSAKVIMDKFTGRSRGFGFVEMPNDEQGQAAIDKLDKAEFEGKVISVSVARPRTDKKPGGNFNQNRRYNNNRYDSRED